MESFRIPPAALRRHYLFGGVGTIALAGVVSALNGVRLPLGLVAVLGGGVLTAIFVVYLIARRRIWVTVLPEGIEGRGIGGGKSLLAWSEQAIVAPVSPPSVSGVRGITLLPVSFSGSPRAEGSVFVPLAICESTSFQTAVRRLAPEGHPLLQVFNRAA